MFAAPNGFGHRAGWTENLSRTGIRIELPEDLIGLPLPRRGEPVEVYVELPATNGTVPRALHCKATIAWARPDEESRIHIALKVTEMGFRDLPGELLSCTLEELGQNYTM